MVEQQISASNRSWRQRFYTNGNPRCLRGIPAGLYQRETGPLKRQVFNFVILHSPKIAGFYDNRQTAFRLSGQFDKALADANKAVDLAPTYPFVFRGRGNVYIAMGKLDLALQDYDEAIRLAPEDGGLLIDRGKIFRSQSKFDQAISDFSHALDLDKKWIAAYRERGLTYKLEGLSEQAIADLTTFDRLQPGDQEVALASKEIGGSGQPTPPAGDISSPPGTQLEPSTGRTSIPMIQDGGTFAVPVTINGQLTLTFIVDSGASDVSIPADVVLTLLRTETITDADFLGKQAYRMADGSTVPSQRFVIRSLKVGNKVLENVTGSIAPVQGSLLLGQSFLGSFQSWSIDNQRRALVLQ